MPCNRWENWLATQHNRTAMFVIVSPEGASYFQRFLKSLSYAIPVIVPGDDYGAVSAVWIRERGKIFSGIDGRRELNAIKDFLMEIGPENYRLGYTDGCGEGLISGKYAC